MLNLFYAEPSSVCACAGCINMFNDPVDCDRAQDYQYVIDEMIAELPSIGRKVKSPLILIEHGSTDPLVTIITRHDDFDPWALFGDATVDEMQQQRRTIAITIDRSGRGLLIIGTRRFTLRPISETLSCLCARLGGPLPRWVTELTEDNAAFLLAVTEAASIIARPFPGTGDQRPVADLKDGRIDGWGTLHNLLVLTSVQREVLTDLLEEGHPLEDAALAAFLTPPRR